MDAVARPGEVFDHVTPGPAQVPNRLLARARDGDGGELSGAVETSQTASIASIGLDPVARSLGDERRRHHIAANSERGEQALEFVASGPGLVAGPQAVGTSETLDQTSDRFFIMENPLDRSDISVGWQDRYRDRILRDVHPKVDESLMSNTGHGRFLLPQCRLHSPQMNDPRKCGCRGAGRSMLNLRHGQG